jgi:hypothetical protein
MARKISLTAKYDGARTHRSTPIDGATLSRLLSGKSIRTVLHSPDPGTRVELEFADGSFLEVLSLDGGPLLVYYPKDSR